MSEVIEVAGYDWTGYWITAGIIMLIALVVGVIIAFASDDGVAVVGMFCVGIVACLIAWVAYDNVADEYTLDQKAAAVENLGYDNVEPSDSGYNQWTASKEGEYVRLAIAPLGGGTYVVTEIQE